MFTIVHRCRGTLPFLFHPIRIYIVSTVNCNQYMRNNHKDYSFIRNVLQSSKCPYSKFECQIINRKSNVQCGAERILIQRWTFIVRCMVVISWANVFFNANQSTEEHRRIWIPLHSPDSSKNRHQWIEHPASQAYVLWFEYTTISIIIRFGKWNINYYMWRIAVEVAVERLTLVLVLVVFVALFLWIFNTLFNALNIEYNRIWIHITIVSHCILFGSSLCNICSSQWNILLDTPHISTEIWCEAYQWILILLHINCIHSCYIRLSIIACMCTNCCWLSGVR